MVRFICYVNKKIIFEKIIILIIILNLTSDITIINLKNILFKVIDVSKK